MNRAKFLKDMEKGEKAEEFIQRELEEEYGTLKKIEGNFKDYDLIAKNGYTFEVKFDELSRVTGNLGFEFKFNNQPSGIATTKADMWVHIYYYPPYWVYSRIPLSKLKGMLKANESYFRKVVGGDNGKSEMLLVGVEVFTDFFDYKIIK